MEEQTKNDRRQAFMHLYEPLHARLDRFVHAQVWNREDARDIISETVLKAYENFHALRKPEAFLGFLFSIASRLVKRRIRRSRFWVLFDEGKAAEIPQHSLSTEELQRLELSRMLQKLGSEQREAISLFEISGFSIREIAALQNCSEGAVKSRLLRARQKLSKLYGRRPVSAGPGEAVLKNVIS